MVLKSRLQAAKWEDCKEPTSRNTQTGKDILGGNFILGGKTGKVEEIFAQLLKKFCINHQIASRSLISVLKFLNFSPATGMIYWVINYQNLLHSHVLKPHYLNLLKADIE